MKSQEIDSVPDLKEFIVQETKRELYKDKAINQAIKVNNIDDQFIWYFAFKKMNIARNIFCDYIDNGGDILVAEKLAVGMGHIMERELARIAIEKYCREIKAMNLENTENQIEG